MAVYNMLTMPDLATYRFLPYSDFSTSGGYGPNQVSSIFGLGIIGLIAAQVLRINLSGNKSPLFAYIILFVLIFALIFAFPYDD